MSHRPYSYGDDARFSISPWRIAAARFLDFVNIRADHDFDAAILHGEIDKRASSP